MAGAGPILDQPGGEFDQDSDRSLVVSSQDCLPSAPIDTILIEYDLDRPLVGNGVEVGTEPDPTITLPFDQAVEVSATRACRGRGIVLEDRKAERLELGLDECTHIPLGAGRACRLTKADEAAQDLSVRSRWSAVHAASGRTGRRQ